MGQACVISRSGVVLWYGTVGSQVLLHRLARLAKQLK
jgi:hypothetical protein